MSLHRKYYKEKATVITQFLTPSILLKKQQKNMKWKKYGINWNLGQDNIKWKFKDLNELEIV